jgi:threonine/homoserine/homoserine lactone efflux protein
VAFFLKGLAFGFVLAATVGPMWVLCFRRTIAQGPLAGLVSGMGIAVADGFYGAVAAFGLTAISGVLLRYSFEIGMVGSAFLIYLGIKTLLSKPEIQGKNEPDIGYSSAFLSTLGLTLANPPTILAFAAIFAGLGLVSEADYVTATLIVAGVFLGSASWWVFLALAAGRLRENLGIKAIRTVNVVSGVSILGFAAWQLTQVKWA